MVIVCECGRTVKHLQSHVKRKIHRHCMRIKQNEKFSFFKNYEECGMSVESIICKLNNIPFVGNTNRLNNGFINDFETKIKHEFCKYMKILDISEYNGHRQNQSDFLLSNGKTLSVKTNYTNKGYKLCPQNIGQSTKKRFIQNFNLPSESTIEQIRSFIENNKVYLLNRYIENLFCCDYLLWFGIDIEKKTIESFLLKNDEITQINIHNKDVSLLRGNMVKEWKSCRISYKNNVIGEYQIHTNRDCVKFRFHTKKLNKLLV